MGKEKKGKAPPLFSWYVVFFPLFGLQWETGEKTAHTCLIPKDDRGVFFFCILFEEIFGLKQLPDFWYVIFLLKAEWSFLSDDMQVFFK